MLPMTKTLGFVGLSRRPFLKWHFPVALFEERTEENPFLLFESLFAKPQLVPCKKKANFSRTWRKMKWMGESGWVLKHSHLRLHIFIHRAIWRIVQLNNCSFIEPDKHLLLANHFEMCDWEWDLVWFCTDSILLITGVLANSAMLWVLLRDKIAFTASQVGVALVITLKEAPRRPISGVAWRRLLVKQHEMSHIRSQVHR